MHLSLVSMSHTNMFMSSFLFLYGVSYLDFVDCNFEPILSLPHEENRTNFTEMINSFTPEHE